MLISLCENQPFAVKVQVSDGENTYQCKTVLVRVHLTSIWGRGQQEERTKMTKTDM